jgi:hypothetical protein
MAFLRDELRRKSVLARHGPAEAEQTRRQLVSIGGKQGNRSQATAAWKNGLCPSLILSLCLLQSVKPATLEMTSLCAPAAPMLAGPTS